MKPIRLRNLAAIAGIFAVAGWSLEGVWVSAGRPLLYPPLSLAIVLAALGVVALLLALPVRRRIRGGRKPINPFYAVRVLAFAQACALTGAICLGAILGLIVYQLTLTVNPFAGPWWLSIAGAGAALLLVVLAVIAEHFCRIPPQSGDDEHARTPSATPDGAA